MLGFHLKHTEVHSSVSLGIRYDFPEVGELPFLGCAVFQDNHRTGKPVGSRADFQGLNSDLPFLSGQMGMVLAALGL